jgi:hypothetical protein
MLIYCSHKYGGDRENKISAEKKVRGLQLRFLEHTFISPIHTLGFMYTDVSYDDGMKLCLSLLDKCDALLVLSDESEGVRREIEYAKTHMKPVLWLYPDSPFQQAEKGR